MTVGHVPLVAPLVNGQLPTRHRTKSLHVWPPMAKVTVEHVRVVWPQPKPEAQSGSSTHEAPAPPGIWHVETPVTPAGQMSGAAQPSSSWQAVPAAPGIAHVWVPGSQKRPWLHWVLLPLQATPTPPWVMATHVCPPPVLPLQVAPGPHDCPFAHDCPMPAAATQTPQADWPPSAVVLPAVQAPPWHCEPVTHAEAAGSVPAANVQGPCVWLRTPQPEAFTADAQVPSAPEVTASPGKASASAQSVSKRPWRRVNSFAGSWAKPKQGP